MISLASHNPNWNTFFLLCGWGRSVGGMHSCACLYWSESVVHAHSGLQTNGFLAVLGIGDNAVWREVLTESMLYFPCKGSRSLFLVQWRAKLDWVHLHLNAAAELQHALLFTYLIGLWCLVPHRELKADCTLWVAQTVALLHSWLRVQ